MKSKPIPQSHRTKSAPPKERNFRPGKAPPKIEHHNFKTPAKGK